MGDDICIFPQAKEFFILEFESLANKVLVLENSQLVLQGDFLYMKPSYLSFDQQTKTFPSAFFGVLTISSLPFLRIR